MVIRRPNCKSSTDIVGLTASLVSVVGLAHVTRGGMADCLGKRIRIRELQFALKEKTDSMKEKPLSA